MTDTDSQDSLVGVALNKLGPNGWEYYNIDNLLPIALSETSDVLTKRLVLLLFANRYIPEINDAAKFRLIVAALREQDPATTFATLFQAYDIALENGTTRLHSNYSTDHRIPLEELCALAGSVLPHVQDKDLPFCTAFLIQTAAATAPEDKTDQLRMLGHGLLDRLEEAFPGEVERLRKDLSSRRYIADHPLVKRILSERSEPHRTPSQHQRPRRAAAPEA